LDKTQPGLTHASDALSYAVSALCPILPHKITGYSEGGREGAEAAQRFAHLLKEMPPCAQASRG